MEHEESLDIAFEYLSLMGGADAFRKACGGGGEDTNIFSGQSNKGTKVICYIVFLILCNFFSSYCLCVSIFVFRGAHEYISFEERFDET